MASDTGEPDIPNPVADAEKHDSLAERIGREEPDAVPPPPHDTVRLLEQHPSWDIDDEAEAIAEEVPPEGLVSPEEAAMHFEEGPSTD